ncbi:MAG TPA: PAS domain S-box protein [Chroococcales cyanobacterium]
MNAPKPHTPIVEYSENTQAALNLFWKLSSDLLCVQGQDGYFRQVNPAWENLLGWTVSELLGMPWIELVHPDDVAVSLQALRQCSPDDIVEYESRYRHKDGSYRQLFWRVLQGEDELFYAVAKEIILSKQAEAKRQECAACGLGDRLEFEQLITGLSTQFINLSSDEIDAGINHALQVIGEFSGFDRSYVVLFSDSEAGAYLHAREDVEGSIIYQWCAESVEPLGEEWQRCSTASHPWLMQKLTSGEAIQISTISELPVEAATTRIDMQSSGTRSIVVVPMVRSKSLIGCVAFASVRAEKTASDDTVALLRIVGEIFTNALSRQQAESKLRKRERLFRAVFNQTFQLSSLLTLDGAVIEDNEIAMNFCQLERSQVIGRPFWELPCWTISPQTQNQLKLAIAQAAAGNVIRYEADILAPDNSVITIDFSLKPLRDEAGQVELLIAEGRDLTERKRAEEALRESEQRWQLALQGSNDGIWDVNLKTNEVFFSARWKEILGYEEHEIPNHLDEWIGRVHPDDLERVMQARQEHLEGRTLESHYSSEYRIRCKDGSYKWILSRAQALWDEAGSPVRFVGSHTDISAAYGELRLRQRAEQALQKTLSELETRVKERTLELQHANEQLHAEIAERQRTEAALRQSEELFRRVFDETPVGMALATCEGSFFRVNRALQDMLGYSESELMTLDCKAVTHPDDWERKLPYLEQLERGEIDSFQIEERYLKKNREILWGKLTSMVLRDKSGEILHAVGLVEDITERKQALEALQHSEARYRAIVEDQTELICRFKSDGTLTFVNEAYCRYFHQQSSQLIGHNFLLLIPEDDRERIAWSFALSQEQPIVSYEHRVLLPCGEMRWQQWTDRAVVFDEQGNAIEFQGVGRDITELKQAEAEIRKALARERELSELRSNFISLVSHEFRTPLTTILSSNEMLDRYNDRLTDEKKQNHHQRIQTAVQRMIQLLEDVLTIGKAEAGKLKFEPAPMDVAAFCRTMVENMQMASGAKHAIAFRTLGECANVYMDRKLLEHIVTNLLSNAIKYSPQGGAIQFELTCMASFAVICIQDRGMGIPVKDIERLFDSFGRASNVGNIPGTGLGLAIVKRCVDLHKGEIVVESEVGVGTTFTVTLPLNRPLNTEV